MTEHINQRDYESLDSDQRRLLRALIWGIPMVKDIARERRLSRAEAIDGVIELISKGLAQLKCDAAQKRFWIEPVGRVPPFLKRRVQ